MIDSPVAALVLLAAIVAVPLVLRRYRTTAPDGLRVVARTALSKGTVVAVLAVGERRLLVGAGERGVQLLSELEPGARGDTGAATGTSTTTDDLGGTDAVGDLSLWLDRDGASAGRAVANPGQVTTAGPRIGLVDRLRAMTVRTDPSRARDGVVNGRPFHVPLDR